jgi:nitroreductase
MTGPVLRPLHEYEALPPDEMQRRARAFHAEAAKRRTVRHFDPRPLPEGVLEDCLRAAGTAPSGANLQPWHFVVVRDAETKRQIRIAAEEEERAFYAGRAPQEWLDALAPLGTDADKPFLEIAPVLIAVFGERWGVGPNGERLKRYYVDESVGLATGLLIQGLHHAGLATLTHTPSPMRFLSEVLERPANERAFLLLVVGYPSPDAKVPDIGRKPLGDFTTFR